MVGNYISLAWIFERCNHGDIVTAIPLYQLCAINKWDSLSCRAEMMYIIGGIMLESQSKEPWFEPPLLLFQILVNIIVLSRISTQLQTAVKMCEWSLCAVIAAWLNAAKIIRISALCFSLLLHVFSYNITPPQFLFSYLSVSTHFHMFSLLHRLQSFSPHGLTILVSLEGAMVRIPPGYRQRWKCASEVFMR